MTFISILLAFSLFDIVFNAHLVNSFVINNYFYYTYGSFH